MRNLYKLFEKAWNMYMHEKSKIAIINFIVQSLHRLQTKNNTIDLILQLQRKMKELKYWKLDL